MKNKKGTYILLFAVAAIWGTVVFRIVKHIRQPDEAAKYNYITTENQQNILYSDTIIKLSLNYPDPFLKHNFMASGQIVHKKGQSININQRISEEKKIQAFIDWPEINFNGIIANSKTSNKTGLLEINSQSFLVRKGETKNEILVLEVYADSVRLAYKNQQKTFIKRN